MSLDLQIVDVYAREILDSRGNPTVEAQVSVKKDGHTVTGRASVPSGASTGEHEAVELRDGDPDRYLGKGVQRAVCHVNQEIKKVLLGKNAGDQLLVDYILRHTDGTNKKSRLGANAILAVSMACARAASAGLGMPLYRYLGGVYGVKMPVPMMNILNGGKHASNTVDFQEFMIMPAGAVDEKGTFVFREGLRWCAEVYQTLKKILESEGLAAAVGDEGGFAPDLKDADEVFSYLTRAVKEAGYEPGKDIAVSYTHLTLPTYLTRAVKEAGYEPGKDIVFAMDAAASELYNPDSGMYFFPGESRCRMEELPREKERVPDTMRTQVLRSTEEMIDLYEQLTKKYPLVSIEDGLDENDWEGWQKLTGRLGDRIQLVGDDLFVTDALRLCRGIQEKAANAVLIKVNQIGTLSEAMETIVTAKQAGYRAVVSHRSGETEDSFIADLSVALNCGQIKTGAPCRSERTAKYNQLLRIEEEVGSVMKDGPLDDRTAKGRTV